MTTAFATSADGLDWKVARHRARRATRAMGRARRPPPAVLPDGRAAYDGRATKEENWFERTGLARPTGGPAARRGSTAPRWTTSRYLDVLALPGGGTASSTRRSAARREPRAAHRGRRRVGAEKPARVDGRLSADASLGESTRARSRVTRTTCRLPRAWATWSTLRRLSRRPTYAIQRPSGDHAGLETPPNEEPSWRDVPAETSIVISERPAATARNDPSGDQRGALAGVGTQRRDSSLAAPVRADREHGARAHEGENLRTRRPLWLGFPKSAAVRRCRLQRRSTRRFRAHLCRSKASRRPPGAQDGAPSSEFFFFFVTVTRVSRPVATSATWMPARFVGDEKFERANATRVPSGDHTGSVSTLAVGRAGEASRTRAVGCDDADRKEVGVGLAAARVRDDGA